MITDKKCKLADCPTIFRGGANEYYCLDCRINRCKDIAAQRPYKQKPKPQKYCACGATIGPYAVAGKCKPCRVREAQAAILVFCSLCGGGYKPANLKSFKKARSARVVFCPTCQRDRRDDVRKISHEARKTKSKRELILGGKSTDRRIARLISEANQTVRIVFEREKNIGVIPPNLIAQYGPALAECGSISAPAPAPRPRRRGPKPRPLSNSPCSYGHDPSNRYTRPDGQLRCRLCVRQHNKNARDRALAKKRGPSVEQFIQRRAAQVESHTS